MTCTMNLIKVKRSCAARRPHSLVQTPLHPKDSTQSKSSEINTKLNILTVAFVLLFNCMAYKFVVQKMVSEQVILLVPIAFQSK